MIASSHFCVLTSRRILSVSGKDTLSFLQGLTTQEVSATTPKYTAFLNHKGRLLFDGMLIPQTEDSIYVDTHHSCEKPLLNHLAKYKLNSDVDLANISGECSVVNAYTLNEVKLTELLSRYSDISYIDPRTRHMGVRILLFNDELDEELAWLHRWGLEIDQDSYEFTQSVLGVPSFPKELIFQETLPMESNLDKLNGVSFHKGCYLGQELTARVHFKGVVRKRILPYIRSNIDLGERIGIELIGPPCRPTHGDEVCDLEVSSDGKSAGKIFTCNGNVGLGMFRLEHIFNQRKLTDSRGFNIYPYFPVWW